MSRTEAFKRFDWDEVDERLASAGVELLSASLDETPGAYKNIKDVMSAQTDLVEIVAEFEPLMVKMAPGRRDESHSKRQREREKTRKKKERRKSR
jgi:tRNA-splicing ligase RtcB